MKKTDNVLNPAINFNNLLTTPSKNTLSSALNDVLTHRFLTKDEMTRVYGYIGDNVAGRMVDENSEYWQKNQLQPVVKYNSGSVTETYDFQDIMNLAKRAGVDVDSFDRWGVTQQFNWVPPFDIDKFVNFKDYYWDGEVGKEDYVTIKNVSNTLNSRRIAQRRALAVGQSSKPAEITTSGQIYINQRVPKVFLDNSVVVISSDSIIESGIVLSSTIIGNTTTLNIAWDGQVPEPQNVEIFPTTFRLVYVDVNANTCLVAGNVSDIAQIGNLVRLFSTSSGEVPINLTISSVEAAPDGFNTVIGFEETIPTNLFNRIDFSVLYRLIQSEYVSRSSEISELGINDAFDNNTTPKIIWNRKYRILPTDSEYITVDLTVPGADFITLPNSIDITDVRIPEPVQNTIGDFVQIRNGPNKGSYEILGKNSSTNRIELDTIGLFTSNDVQLEIFRKNSYVRILEPLFPILNDYWLDADSNSLKRYDGSQWIVQELNILPLLNYASARPYNSLIQTDQWALTNKWVHKSDINGVGERTNARAPIIEFDAGIEKVKYSISTKEWEYRSTPAAPFSLVSNEPKLIESTLIDWTKFSFSNDGSQIFFDASLGDLSAEVNIGDFIRLVDFINNDGLYQVANVEYSRTSPSDMFRTVMTLVNTLPNPSDRQPLVNSDKTPHIGPELTTFGDFWTSFFDVQWKLAGVKSVISTSRIPEPNRMLNDFIEFVEGPAITPGNSDTNFRKRVGLFYTEYQLKDTTNVVNSPLLELPENLKQLCLYDDYQEGDIRVYIDGVRQFGNFTDIQSDLDENYVGFIKFDESVYITSENIIRIELGEIADIDIGRRARLVNTGYGTDLFNLTRFRLAEQSKTELNTNPVFSVYDSERNPLDYGSTIFEYAKSEDAVIDSVLKQRVLKNSQGQYIFNNKTIENGSLVVFRSDSNLYDEYRTVWARGFNTESFAQTKIGDIWNVAPQLFYNLKHENRSTLSFDEIFTHLNSILSSQSDFVSKNLNALLPGDMNFGVGGYIKEHNDQFDLFISTLLACGYQPQDLLDFVRTQYQQNYFNIITEVTNNLLFHISTENFIESVISFIEVNDNYNKIFGDSSTYDEKTDFGVKNWIPSLAYIGLLPKTRPYFFKDGEDYFIVRHDSSKFIIKSDDINVQSIINNLSNSIETVETLPESGEFVIYLNNIYKYDNEFDTWTVIDIIGSIVDILIEVENRLFTQCPNYDVLRYDIFKNYQDQFYIKSLYSDFQIDSIVSSDPFNFNYKNSTPTAMYNGSSLQPFSYSGAYKIYFDIFGTGFPHREPWILQGFNDKPDWWDSEYKDITGSRVWVYQMWENIINGIVPAGYALPNGNISLGGIQQVNFYSGLPVNITNAPIAGVPPDGLLPPAWDIAQSTSQFVFPLLSVSNVTNAELPATIGEMGNEEFIWSLGQDYYILAAKSSYYTDPLKFLEASWGNFHNTVACLQIDTRTNKVSTHTDTIFHGQIVNNNIFKINGLNQVFVQKARYDGVDNFSSTIFDRFKNWDVNIAYNTRTIIDYDSLTLVNDAKLTDKDYSVLIKSGIFGEAKTFSALDIEMLEVPSRYSKSRDFGIGWKVKIDSRLPNNSYKIRGVQNYVVNMTNTSGVYEIDSYNIENISFNSVDKVTTIELLGDLRFRFRIGNSITIDGVTYVIRSVTWDGDVTLISFKTESQITSTNNKVLPYDRRTLPNWDSNNELLIRSSLPLETNFFQEVLYFIERIDDTTFRLYDGPQTSYSRAQIFDDILSGEILTIGNPKATFQTRDFDGWITFEEDNNYYDSVKGSVFCNGIQNVVDFLTSYYYMLRSEGILELSENGENLENGRPVDWQLEIEKFIDWSFLIRKQKLEESPAFDANLNGSTLILVDYDGTLKTGDQITVTRTVLGNRREDTLFVIKLLQESSIQLALDRYSATVGRSIDLTGFGSDIVVTKGKFTKTNPIFEISPYKNFLHVEHEYGIIDNLLDFKCKPTFYGIYDNHYNRLSVDKLVFIRNDYVSQIRLTGDVISTNASIQVYDKTSNIRYGSIKTISHGTFDLLEHNNIILFNDTAIGGTKQYDPFLGIRMKNVLFNALVRSNKTGRMVVSGYSFDEDGNFLPNIEKSVSDIRNYYDRYKNTGKTTFNNLLKTIGYSNDFDYLNDFGFTDVTKFELWRGFLQNKGTNFTLRAFTNNKTFNNLSVDEYWAYKQAEFGDSKPRVYPEMYINASESRANDIRYEFVAPDEVSLDASFTQVRLTDLERWYSQPDQIEKMQPYKSFFFEADPIFAINLPEENSKIIVIDGKEYVRFDTPVAGVLLTTLDEQGNRNILIENKHYVRLSSLLIRFLEPSSNFSNITISGFDYSKKANNPAKLIDTSGDETITDIEIWNPAAGQYYSKAAAVISFFEKTDPAVYSIDVSNGLNSKKYYWDRDFEGTLWADVSKAYYVPYYDIKLIGGQDESIFHWGELADGADLAVYRWTKVDVPPSEWENRNPNIKFEDKIQGVPKLNLYKNVGSLESPEWEAQPTDQIYEYLVALVEDTTTVPGNPDNVRIYINGKFRFNLDLTQYTLKNYCDPNFFIEGKDYYLSTDWYEGDILTVQVDSFKPSHVELDSGLYKYDAPYTEITTIDSETSQEIKEYFYWVRDTHTKTVLNGVDSLNHVVVEQYLKSTPEPYLIPTGFRSFESGYGLIYGLSFDTDDFNLPNRFTRVVVRGINGLVTDDRRFIIRWTRDLSLRDELLQNRLNLNNKHTEWKLFRQQQPSRIDRYLWDRVEEAAINLRVIGGKIPNNAVQLPSRERKVFDTIYGTKTRYGLGKDSVLADWSDINEVLNFYADRYEVIRTLILDYDLQLLEDRLNLLEQIYTSIDIKILHEIFFEILHIFLAKSNDQANVIKTSWVAIDLDTPVILTPSTIKQPPLLVNTFACNPDIFISEPIPDVNPNRCYILAENGDYIDGETNPFLFALESCVELVYCTMGTEDGDQFGEELGYFPFEMELCDR